MRRSALALVPVMAAALAGLVLAADESIPWSEAEGHVGQNVTVEGRVLGIHCSPTACLLAFDPTFNRFTAVVQAKDFKTLPPETLDASYVGRQVRVRGTIQLLERKPEIVVGSTDDLQLVVTKEERAERHEQAQTDIVDRLDDIIDRLDAMAARMEETQAQLAQVAAALAQQSEQLAALQATASTPPPQPMTPTYGEPQARPAWEALRTIKRGMTSDEIARLVGSPTAIESNSTGGYIWDYGYGRSVTFDRRNRATALVGFPPP
jgi:O6-methylguanine-DNA--protein-cysteine methyltransferase